MGTEPSQASTGSAPIWAEFDAEIVTLDIGVARASQAISAAGVLIAIYVAVFVAPQMGKSLAIAALLVCVWFTAAHELLRKGRSVNRVRVVNALVELAVPGVALVLMAKTQGAAYALASWVPPLLLALLVFLSIVRLKPILPLVTSAVGALEYLAIYWFVIRDAPLLGYLDSPLYHAPLQFTRAASILMFGVVGSLASRALRKTVGQAAKQTRAKELFGKYRIHDKIASGGMGTVYEALYCPEGGFERKVAIKRVHPHLAEDGAFIDRFRAEAELCARLAHPNIVAVFDFGREGETYFFAMEHIAGMDLLKMRKRCRAAGLTIPASVVAFIGREIAEGLAFAHEIALDSAGKPLRVVHRDLNPSNVLLSFTGQVKISDFGVAKALGESRDYETLHFVGKMPYLAPEQAKGDPFDARADLFALGLVIWELLCLRPVFQRETDAETLLAVVHANAPAPSSERADLGAPWDVFLEKALRADPSARFQSAREMSAALATLIEHEGALKPDELSVFMEKVRATPMIPPSKPALRELDDVATVRESSH